MWEYIVSVSVIKLHIIWHLLHTPKQIMLLKISIWCMYVFGSIWGCPKSPNKTNKGFPLTFKKQNAYGAVCQKQTLNYLAIDKWNWNFERSMLRCYIFCETKSSLMSLVKNPSQASSLWSESKSSLKSFVRVQVKPKVSYGCKTVAPNPFFVTDTNSEQHISEWVDTKTLAHFFVKYE